MDGKRLGITTSIGLWYWAKLNKQQIRCLIPRFRIIVETEQFITTIHCSAVSDIQSKELVSGSDSFSSDKQDRQYR